jgi:hypothetical protein
MTPLLLALFLGLPGKTKINCEDAMKIGRSFLRDYGVHGLMEMTAAGPNLEPNRRGTAWGLKFLRNSRDEFEMNLDEYGEVESFNSYNHHSDSSAVTVKNWKQEAVRRGHNLVRRLGASKPFLDPKVEDVIPNWRIFYPTTFNGLRIFGSAIGYSIQLEGDKYEFVGFTRDERSPVVNGKMPFITAEKAIALVNEAFPSDSDFERRSGTFRYVFEKPELSYYWSGKVGETAQLIWHFSGMHDRNVGHAIQGGGFNAAIDASTGALIQVSPGRM